MDRALLSRATAATENAVQGYDLEEIAKMSCNGPDTWMRLEEYLLRRLLREDPNVKLKVLRVMKHVFIKGHPEFKKSMRRKADKIRACQSYHTAPHPLLGDAPARSVREEADKCLEVLFSDATGSRSGTLLHRIEGVGTSNAINTSTSHSRNDPRNPTNSQTSDLPLNKRIVGIGNPEYLDRTSQPNSVYSTAENTFKMISETAGKYFPGVKQQLIRGAQNIAHYGGFAAPHTFTGASWSNSSNIPNTPPSTTYQSPNRPEPVEIRPKMANLTRSGNEYEAKLVDDLLAPGGVKTVSLPAHVIQEFLKKCQSLDGEVLLQLLFEHYLDSKATVQLKQRVLLVVEAMLASKSPQMIQQKQQMKAFIIQKYAIQLREDKTNASLKAKAHDVLYYLDLEATRYQKPKKMETGSNDFLDGFGEQTAEMEPTTSSTNEFFFDDTPELEDFDFFVAAPINKKDPNTHPITDIASLFPSSNNSNELLFDAHAHSTSAPPNNSPSLSEFDNFKHTPTDSRVSMNFPISFDNDFTVAPVVQEAPNTAVETGAKNKEPITSLIFNTTQPVTEPIALEFDDLFNDLKDKTKMDTKKSDAKEQDAFDILNDQIKFF